MSAAYEGLLRAAELLDKPGAWTQEVPARDRFGVPCGANSPNAVQFCVLGALDRSLLSPWRDGCNDILRAEKLLFRVVGSHVAFWNDRHVRTQAEVVAALRKAAVLDCEFDEDANRASLCEWGAA